ncbi:hypothetical protein SULPSESMR1_05025 (plasmid) [Pseudosulfitobacter pseudonitzschiae]|uniref:Uncharacterized protein n=1 Tax=Pseudosulfitobacter pseudonitzschiae TaxID=1402135 RepID=A0A221K6W4_9RHOB|nr:hypothetical protein SULPSESMR1_05025 [Pseudosulfitobacter pseudonitzschiae]
MTIGPGEKATSATFRVRLRRYPMGWTPPGGIKMC